MPLSSLAETVHPSGPRPARVQALDRGLQLLELLGEAREPMSLADLAELVQVDRSTAHRLLGTLGQRGYITQDARTRRYSLGLKTVELGRHALEGLSLRTVARRYLPELARETGESANLVLRAGHQAVCVELAPSPSILSVTNEIGTVFAPHATASGKVLLAYAVEADRLAWLSAAPRPAFTPRTITDLTVLASHLQQVARQGYAVDDEESHLGVRCVAAPIYDHWRNVVAAVSLSGPAMRVTLERLPALAARLLASARAISNALGYPAAEHPPSP
jgi:IclR family acetate operon transcriptional repressor